MDRIQRLRNGLVPLRDALLSHPVYREIDSLAALRVFMEHHVFAVWDFMSLLKTLQRRICCVGIPWLPGGNPTCVRFVNEIVLAEESDENGEGGYASHFDLYHQAMMRCGANTGLIDRFVAELRQGRPVGGTLAMLGAPDCVGRFVRKTFEIIGGENLAAIAAAFTFGREDILPELFRRIVDELNESHASGLDGFRYYLNRHIGLDGDEHGPMGRNLVVSLCGTDEALWRAAENGAVESLKARLDLWDGVHARLRQGRTP